MTMRLPRRDFLRTAGLAGLAGLAAPRLFRAATADRLNPVGYATISWPRGELDAALQTISSLHYEGAQLLGWVESDYPGASRLKEKLDALNLAPVALSCWGITLDPDNLGPVPDKFADYARFFHGVGGLYLQVTDGGKPNATYTPEQVRALGQRMNDLGRIAGDAGLQLGYHPHFGTIGETREGLGRVLDATRAQDVGLIVDVAHLTLGGADPAEVIRTYKDRFLFTHFKDVRPDIAKLAAQNRDLVRKSPYHFCEIGTGVVNFPEIIRAMRQTDFYGWVIVELDGYAPPAGGAAESARINRRALESLGLLPPESPTRLELKTRFMDQARIAGGIV